jgi:hypothetical protein
VESDSIRESKKTARREKKRCSPSSQLMAWNQTSPKRWPIAPRGTKDADQPAEWEIHQERKEVNRLCMRTSNGQKPTILREVSNPLSENREETGNVIQPEDRNWDHQRGMDCIRTSKVGVNQRRIVSQPEE